MKKDQGSHLQPSLAWWSSPPGRTIWFVWLQPHTDLTSRRSWIPFLKVHWMVDVCIVWLHKIKPTYFTVVAQHGVVTKSLLASKWNSISKKWKWLNVLDWNHRLPANIQLPPGGTQAVVVRLLCLRSRPLWAFGPPRLDWCVACTVQQPFYPERYSRAPTLPRSNARQCCGKQCQAPAISRRSHVALCALASRTLLHSRVDHVL